MRADFYSQLAALERARGLRIGARLPADEPVRFVPAVSLAFAARDVEAQDSSGREWVTSFAGLTGADGALPPYMAEEIANEDPDRPVRRALLTPFHHRATALLFRSVHRCRVPEETRTHADPWPRRVVALVRGELVDDGEREIALVLAPLLHGPPSAANLARALRVVARRWLGDGPIRLVERTGGREPVDRGARALLGRTRLGDTAILGASVEDPCGRATIHVGPLEDAYLASLAPGATGLHALRLVVGWLADSATEVEVVVHHAPAPLRVGGARLGQCALGASPARTRARPLDLHATRAPSPRQALSKVGTSSPAKESACDPIPARSCSA